MSRPIEEPFVADSGLIALSRPEQVFLYVADALHGDSNRVEYNTCDISSCSKRWLWVLSNVGRVQHRDWKGDCPHPKHLENPEAKKGEEFIALVIESIVLACFQNSEKKEGGQSQTPDHDEKRSHDLPCMVMATECEGDDCKYDKIRSTSEIRELVELQGECNAEKEELITNGNQKSDGEVVVVEDMDLHF